jgi:hypothetical protein
VLNSEAFYLDDPPAHPQQGDICAGVPILLLPPSEELILLRSTHYKRTIPELEAGEVKLVREHVVSDAFDEGSEYVAVAAKRIYAMLMTPTCDVDSIPIYAVWPLSSIADNEDINLNATNIYQLPPHSYFPDAFIDFGDFRAVRREHFMLKDRVASITREARHDLMDRYYESIGRRWGYRAGETVEPLNKYETGTYRCARCAVFDIPAPEVTLKAGGRFPECENCKKIHKSAQWYPLTKHRKT